MQWRKKIYETAASYGIEKKDILVDALCMAVSSDKNGAMTTLETVKRVKEELGGKTVLGVSNISFGLPMREHINSAFFLLALENGLSAAIINPGLPAMAAAYKSFLVLHGMDENCSGYVEKNTGRRRRPGRQNRRPGRKRRLESGKTDPRELGKLKVPEVPMVRQRWKEIRQRLL